MAQRSGALRELNFSEVCLSRYACLQCHSDVPAQQSLANQQWHCDVPALPLAEFVESTAWKTHTICGNVLLENVIHSSSFCGHLTREAWVNTVLQAWVNTVTTQAWVNTVTREAWVNTVLHRYNIPEMSFGLYIST